MTIYEIKRRTEKTSPYFFSKNTMKFFGQTLKSFKIYKEKDSRFKIVAPSYWDSKFMGNTIRFFNPINNILERK